MDNLDGTKDLTKGPIGKKLMSLALPIMATSFIQMAYTLTDIAWVGRIGSEAVAAIGIIGYANWMVSAVALLNKVGAEVSISQAIGAKDTGRARILSTHNLTMSVILSVVMCLLFFVGASLYVHLFKLQEDIASLSESYLRIFSTGFPFMFLAATFTGIYNAAGLSKIPFYISSIGLGINMILDPLFIFVFRLGTDGAAYATWISQAIVAGLFIYQIVVRDKLLGGFPLLGKLKKEYVNKLTKIGAPVSIFNGLFCLCSMFMVRLASEQGGYIGVMCFSTGSQIEAITWNSAQGLSTALSTFVGQNYSAGLYQRVMRAFKITLFIGLGIGTFSTLLFLFAGENLFAIFVPEEEAYIAGGQYLYVLAFSQIAMFLEISGQGLFYGVGRTIPPAINSIFFNYMRIPITFLFIYFGWGLESIWWSITDTTILKGFILLGWFYLLRNRIFNLKNKENENKRI